MSGPGLSDVHVPSPSGIRTPPTPDPSDLPGAALATFRDGVKACRADDPEATPDQCNAAGWAAVRQAWRQTGGGWVKKSLASRLTELLQAEEPAETPAFDGVAKAVGDQRLVLGWANVIRKDAHGQIIPDKQGDQVDMESLERVVYGWIESYDGASGVMHVGKADSRAVESVVFTPEKLDVMLRRCDISPEAHAEVVAKMAGRVWIGLRVTPAVFERVKKGDLRALSIEGRGERVEVSA